MNNSVLYVVWYLVIIFSNYRFNSMITRFRSHIPFIRIFGKIPNNTGQNRIFTFKLIVHVR